MRRAARTLETLGDIRQRSSLYDTSPIGGPEGQANYLNAVIALMPSRELRSPIKLLTQLLKIEQDFGRERRVRWDARTLDLDLLSYGNVILKNHDLVLPHPRMLERAFVLAPLCEIAPDWTHPVTQKLACESLSQLGRQEVKQTDLTWNLDQG